MHFHQLFFIVLAFFGYLAQSALLANLALFCADLVETAIAEQFILFPRNKFCIHTVKCLWFSKTIPFCLYLDKNLYTSVFAKDLYKITGIYRELIGGWDWLSLYDDDEDYFTLLKGTQILASFCFFYDKTMPKIIVVPKFALKF